MPVASRSRVNPREALGPVGCSWPSQIGRPAGKHTSPHTAAQQMFQPWLWVAERPATKGMSYRVAVEQNLDVQSQST